MTDNALEVSVPIEKVESELAGIELALIEAIRAHCEKHEISIRQLAALVGTSYGKVNYHLSGGGDSTLYNLLFMAQKIGLTGFITLQLNTAEEKEGSSV